jgi:hypothetical protein
MTNKTPMNTSPLLTRREAQELAYPGKPARYFSEPIQFLRDFYEARYAELMEVRHVEHVMMDGERCCGACGHIAEDDDGDPYRFCPGCGVRISNEECTMKKPVLVTITKTGDKTQPFTLSIDKPGDANYHPTCETYADKRGARRGALRALDALCFAKLESGRSFYYNGSIFRLWVTPEGSGIKFKYVNC